MRPPRGNLFNLCFYTESFLLGPDRSPGVIQRSPDFGPQMFGQSPSNFVHIGLGEAMRETQQQHRMFSNNMSGTGQSHMATLFGCVLLLLSRENESVCSQSPVFPSVHSSMQMQQHTPPPAYCENIACFFFKSVTVDKTTSF